VVGGGWWVVGGWVWVPTPPGEGPTGVGRRETKWVKSGGGQDKVMRGQEKVRRARGRRLGEGEERVRRS